MQKQEKHIQIGIGVSGQRYYGQEKRVFRATDKKELFGNLSGDTEYF